PRDRRHAESVLARTNQYPQTSAHPRRRFRPGPGHAQVDRQRNPARAPGGVFAALRAHFRALDDCVEHLQPTGTVGAPRGTILQSQLRSLISKLVFSEKSLLPRAVKWLLVDYSRLCLIQ